MNIIQKIYHLYSNTSAFEVYSHQKASDLIKAELMSQKPSMIARIGSTELLAMAYYVNSKKPFRKIIENFKKDIIFSKMTTLSGFFPSNEETINRFAELMLNDMELVDILGSWRKEEKLFAHELKNAVKIRLEDLEPYYHSQPWSVALENKVVLVIHPFEESIKTQFKIREKLFADKNVLPEFKLETIKAVQSIANNKPEYDTWFDALEYMKDRIDAVNFDIALIGCGAYGFPLAAHIKRKGKKAVLMGGALQILFGISGKRWEEHPVVSKFINQYWTKPLPSEVPQNSKRIDGGSYW